MLIRVISADFDYFIHRIFLLFRRIFLFCVKVIEAFFMLNFNRFVFDLEFERYIFFEAFIYS